MIVDTNDIHSAALCAWKEARGEQEVGMCAVLWVLKNRVGHTGFPFNLHDVIYGKNQFTSMSVPSDPEFSLQPASNDSLFALAMRDANLIFKDDSGATDMTCGAHYYANLHTMDADGWFYRNIVLNSKEHPITAQIGHHTFFL